MRLKNVLIVVSDIERAKKFYVEMFGLYVVLENKGNVIMTEGLVLQDKTLWEQNIGKGVQSRNNSSLIYFEEYNLEDFVEKLEKLYPSIEYINKMETDDTGRRMIRFYDLDGNIIEIRTPNNNVL